jgi:hypothetical protein
VEKGDRKITIIQFTNKIHIGTKITLLVWGKFHAKRTPKIYTITSP